MKKLLFVSVVSIVVFLFLTSTVSAQMANLWQEGQQTVAKNEPVSLQLSTSSKDILKSACLLDGNEECQSLPAVNGVQAGFIVMPRPGRHIFSAAVTTASGLIKSNPLNITIRDEDIIPPAGVYLKFETGGWFRVFNGKTKEWSKPFREFVPGYSWDIFFISGFQVQDVSKISLHIETTAREKTELVIVKEPVGTIKGRGCRWFGEDIEIAFPKPTSTPVTLRVAGNATVKMSIDDIFVFQWNVVNENRLAPAKNPHTTGTWGGLKTAGGQ